VVLDQTIILLSGGIHARSCGFAATGDDGDFAKAAFLVRMSVASESSASDAFGVASEAAHSLVASPRFQAIAAAVADRLVDELIVPGAEVERWCREADPGHVVESHSASYAPWYEVTCDGRLLHRSSDLAAAKRVQRANRGSMLVGSIYS
jgi:hypothetical protein